MLTSSSEEATTIYETFQNMDRHVQFNRCAYSFYKHLIKCKNIDDNFFIEIEAIVHNVSHLRIKEALLIAKLHPQINSRLELNTEYIIN